VYKNRAGNRDADIFSFLGQNPNLRSAKGLLTGVPLLSQALSYFLHFSFRFSVSRISFDKRRFNTKTKKVFRLTAKKITTI